jgi:hypothetical protein
MRTLEHGNRHAGDLHAAVLLDTDPEVVKKARVLALRELPSNLAELPGWTSTAARPYVVHNGIQHA